MTPAPRPQSIYPLRSAMHGRVGMVVPAWFSPQTPPDQARELLTATLAGAGTCLDPADTWVVVDGSPVAARAAREVLDNLSTGAAPAFRILDLPENQGKGRALCAGLHALLAGEGSGAELAWFAVRDADGDHFLDDLPHLYRAGEQAAAACPDRPVWVVGGRSTVHAPLGWVRGEYEHLVNEVVVEAVSFALAQRGQVWDTRFLPTRIPDLQSGYKLYDRRSAVLTVESLPREASAYHDLDLGRTGMEIVPFVCLALTHGLCVEVERKTFYDQPVSSYGSVDRPAFYGAKLAWALQTCRVPTDATALLLDAALIRRPLYTDPTGRPELLRFRERVLALLGASDLCTSPLSRLYL